QVAEDGGQLGDGAQVAEGVDGTPEELDRADGDAGIGKEVGGHAAATEDDRDLMTAIEHGAGEVANVDGGAADRIRPGDEVGDVQRGSLRATITRNASLRKAAQASGESRGSPTRRAKRRRPGRARRRKRM